ncbi:MAG: Rne/Rng family ribonuclease [Acidobacteriaceae bacterium]|nr:Rne/Rng family ribonuclease [Acidobacteriaceae bacterium]
MSKEIYISSTPQETRLAIVESDALSEIYYERENEYTLAGSIYNGRVTRVLPGMQSSFVDIGLERDAFLYITDFMEEAGESAEFEGERSSGGSGNGGGGGRRRGRRGNGERPRVEGESTEETTDLQAEDGGEEYAAEGSPREEEEIGEGAPGADGSRRWRGRRGRRRGRGGDRGNERGAAGQAQPSEEPQVVVEGGYDNAEPFAAAEEPQAVEESSFEAPRREGGRREGRRGRRDRDRGERRERGERAQAEPQAESLAFEAAAGEPFILPGESLSKYRPRAEGETDEPKEELKATAPVVDAFVAAGWDGGLVLPGETLRSRGASSSAAPAADVASDEDIRRYARAERGEAAEGGRDRRRDRDGRRGRRERAIDPAEAVLPAVTSQHEPEATVLPLTDDAPSFETAETEERFAEAHAHEQDTAHAEFLAQRQQAQAEAELEVESLVIDAAPAEPAVSEEVVEATEEFHETVAEYEPEENASASFRVDTGETREFRQSAPAEEPAAEEHEFTSVQSSGEMLSEPVVVEEGAEESSPIEHEGAVLDVHAGESESAPLAAQQHFEPGEGDLEEELLDEEDDGVLTLQASDFDDTEEETLEAAPELGALLNDMSLDALVIPDVAEDDLDEEMDFEDEDLEEDELDEGEELSGSDISEAEEEAFVASDEFEESDDAVITENPERRERSGRRGRGRRGGSRGAQRERAQVESAPERSEPREERSEGGEPRAERSERRRDRRGMAGSRSGGRMSRASAQLTNLPAISDLLKPGQEVLVQIAKEPIAKKGARITSHIALPGRFLVFMPTVSHVGVSRKIESDGERRRLKEILLSERGEASGGFIVRTAAAGASEEELRSDLRFLLNLWADIKQRSEASKSPALIYHDLNLVERILRDQVTDNFSAIWVDTEDAYERVLRFLQRFQPSLIRRVKLYTKETPLFEQFGISEEINKALRSKVWLKSGGSIVINQTEALVAIDINTGKYVGKTARLEDTIVKTNLDAIPEIVRQIRLRDLGGIIVIDFIDMDERKNRQKVLQALEEELKKDRAPSKVLQFNDFGLVAITRKRVKQSLERTLSTTCSICAGTGMVKSPVTVCNEIYIELRKMHKHLDKGDVMLRVHPEVVKHLKLNNAKWLQEMEEMSSKTILVKSDPSLHPEQFDIH